MGKYLDLARGAYERTKEVSNHEDGDLSREGATVKSDSEAVTKETKETKESQAPNPAWSQFSLDVVEREHVALRIESRDYGTLWLVSTEAERGLADDGTPTYTVAEARKMIGLPEKLIRQIHAFKRVFKGSLDRVEEDTP